MKIPDSIRIGPFDYVVKRNYIFTGPRDFWGQQDATLLELRFSDSNQGSDAPETRTAESRVHELLHAISGAFLPGSDQLSELQVELMAKGILDTFRRNGIDLLNTESDNDKG